MKHTIKVRARQFAKNPLTRKALVAIKPEKSVWGFLGIVFFFIVPEIIAFIWGRDITAYSKHALLTAASGIERQYYEMLVMLFQGGGSWINLAIGVTLLVWFFF